MSRKTARILENKAKEQACMLLALASLASTVLLLLAGKPTANYFDFLRGNPYYYGIGFILVSVLILVWWKQFRVMDVAFAAVGAFFHPFLFFFLFINSRRGEEAAGKISGSLISAKDFTLNSSAKIIGKILYFRLIKMRRFRKLG